MNIKKTNDQKIPWHKEALKDIEFFEDVTFGYLIFKDGQLPTFEEAELSSEEQNNVLHRIKTNNPLFVRFG